jgi:hypothetical protein
MIDQPVQIDPLKDMSEGLDWLRSQTLPAQIQVMVAKDRAITEALQAIQPLWTKEEIGRRCLLMRCIGSEIEQLFVDGQVVLVFQPSETKQEWHDDRLVITITQKFKRVQMVKL